MSTSTTIGSCRPGHPMPKDAKGAWGHEKFRDLSDENGIRYECLVCGHSWGKPWPVQA